jgi:DNA-binding transcriptional LysR family regulator
MKPRKSYMQADTLDGMIQCAVQGMGIIEAPDLISIKETGLKQIMPDLMGPQVTYYFIYSESRKTSNKINALFNHLKNKKM